MGFNGFPFISNFFKDLSSNIELGNSFIKLLLRINSLRLVNFPIESGTSFNQFRFRESFSRSFKSLIQLGIRYINLITTDLGEMKIHNNKSVKINTRRLFLLIFGFIVIMSQNQR